MVSALVLVSAICFTLLAVYEWASYFDQVSGLKAPNRLRLIEITALAYIFWLFWLFV